MVLTPPDNSIQPKPTSVPQVQNDPNDNYTTIVNNFKQEIASKQGKVVTADSDSGFYGSYYGEWELLGQGTQELDPTDNKYKRVDTYVKYRYDFSIKPQYQTVTKAGQRRDVVYDQNIRPKMSDIRINFSAQGMKPRTRLNAFFGDRNVTSACMATTYRPDGQPIISDQLVTDERGEIRGTFTYSESDLNFDAGFYIFALSDSSRNDNDRNTYASAVFNGSGLTGYAEETFRTRMGELTVNKTSTVTVSDPRTVVVGEGPATPPPVVAGTPKTDLDLLEAFFIYGFGRRPTAEEKAHLYDKWQSYGVHTMTTWNNIVMQNPSNGANTNGNEIFREYGFLRVDQVLSYVDRAISVVPNGTDNADLRSKYLAAATYNYGKYDWYYEKDKPIFPATINYMQFLNLDPTQSLTPPWLTDLSYDCFNAEGKKVWNALFNSLADVYTFIGGYKTAQDYGGQMAWYARSYGFINYDNNGVVSLGTPKMPKQQIYVRDTSDISNSHVITTVWDSTITDDCMQPHRVVVAPATGGTTQSSSAYINITMSSDAFETAYNIFTSNKSTGALAAGSGGSGTGPGWNKPKNEYPINEFSGAPEMWQPLATYGSYTGNLIIPNTPYVLQCLHYGNHTTQIIIAVNNGQNGNTSPVPIRISCLETGTFYDTWIPPVSGSGYWDDGSSNSNYVDVYTQYKGTDPLGISALVNQYKPVSLQISVRDANEVVTAPPANGGYGGGTTGGAGAGSDNNVVKEIPR
jgi:hypothetical protein